MRLIPAGGLYHLGVSLLADPNGKRQRLLNASLAASRASVQGLPASSPERARAARLSISAAHAASTSASGSPSRLASNSAASSARSESSSWSASSSTFWPILLISSKLPRNSPSNKALWLTSHSAFQPTLGSLWHCSSGASIELRRHCGSQLSTEPLGGVMYSRILFAILLLLASSSRAEDCLASATTQAEMNRCACDEARLGESALQAECQALLARHASNAEVHPLIQDAQRAYQALRKAHLAALNAAAGGSVAPMCVCLAATSLAKSQRSLVSASPEGDLCAW